MAWSSKLQPCSPWRKAGLIEPDRSHLTAELAGTSKPTSESEIVRGADVFAATIDTAPTEQQPVLKRLLQWARELERERLATLYTSIGKGRWVLNARLPGQSRGMVSIWNEKGTYLSPYRSVIEQEAPVTLKKLDEAVPNEIGRGNYIKTAYDDSLLALLREAYVEARDSRAWHTKSGVWAAQLGSVGATNVLGVPTAGYVRLPEAGHRCQATNVQG
jgi:hypothetical protein